jgi:hypothetical protein
MSACAASQYLQREVSATFLATSVVSPTCCSVRASSRTLCLVTSTAHANLLYAAVRLLDDTCKVQLKNWDQCGGKSGCKGATCTSAPWKGYCCPQGSKCVKNDDYYSNCQPPAGQSGGSSRSAGGAPAPVDYKVAPPVKARKSGDGEDPRPGTDRAACCMHTLSCCHQGCCTHGCVVHQCPCGKQDRTQFWNI